MKRWMVVVVTIVALGLMPLATPVAAQAVPGQVVSSVGTPDGSPYDYFVGGGTTASLHFALAAHNNSQLAPTGHVVLSGLGTTGQTKLQGSVACLFVGANVGVLAFRISQTNDSTNFPADSFEQVVGIDNGNPTNGVSPDLFGAAGQSVPSPCSGFSILALPLTSGNIVVHGGVTSLAPSPSMTDNSTYVIDTQYNVYTAP
jgi:hypothetical protein